MSAERPFEVLFLTNFSDSCYRAIPAVAQLSDEVDLRLTILHAHTGQPDALARKEDALRSFFPEADDYTGCRRLLVHGSPVDAVRTLKTKQPIDLVVAPPGDPLGMPRLGHRSIRSLLIRDAALPTWTSGASASASRILRPTRHVACTVELEQDGKAHLELACAYAEAMGATLHLVHVLPEVEEGHRMMQLAAAEPFDEVHAMKACRKVGASRALPVDVRVTDIHGLSATLSDCEADVVFLDGAKWMSRRWLTFRMRRMLDELPCPAVCIDARRCGLHWQLPRNPAKAATTTPAHASLGRAVDPTNLWKDHRLNGELVAS